MEIICVLLYVTGMAMLLLWETLTKWRDSSERFGSVFNKHGAKLFNDFIAKAGLTEVPLGGCIFTWCHKTTSKMSKLDRFLVSDSLLCNCPRISSVTLDRNNLAIRGVLVDGNWVESPQLVKNEFYTHFKQRFEKPNLSGIQFDREFPNKICSEQAVDLEREVSKEEVKRAVWDCGTDKAPGPDGFTFGFYRRFWNLIECDVVNAVKWFFLHERIPSGGNSSFITLIPKVSNANMVKDFRPISLIGSVYKIVAKILANRLVLWNQSNIDTIVRVLKIGCMALKMPFKYLGSVVGDRMSRVKAWNDVIELWGICFKWAVAIYHSKNSLWAKVITAIHGDDGKIGKTVKPTFLSIWLNIIQEVAVMKLKGIDVVATKLSHVDLEWSFRRKSRGGAEQIQMTTLKEILEGCILSDTKDTWTWSLEGSGEFSVSSIRKTIDAAFLPCGNVKTRWVKEVPIKINILAWKVSNDYLPTRFNLSRLETLVLFLRFIQSDHVQDLEVVGFGISGD
ncbi:hypothetical protein Tco_0868855 [Tanacetum coccineum]